MLGWIKDQVVMLSFLLLAALLVATVHGTLVGGVCEFCVAAAEEMELDPPSGHACARDGHLADVPTMVKLRKERDQYWDVLTGRVVVGRSGLACHND